MKCKNCGSAIREGTSFCLSCGAQVETKKKGSAQGGVKALIIALVCSVALLSGVAAYAILSGRLGGAQTAPDAESGKTAVDTVKNDEKDPEPVKEDPDPATEPDPTTDPATEPTTEPEPEPEPEPVSEYGSGSTSWKGLTASYQQTGEGLVDLKFENTGNYKFEIHFMSTGDFGITVFAFTEDGQSKKVIIKDYGSVLNIDPYNGSVSISSVKFDELEGRITEIRIMNVRYKNMNDNYDFGYKDGPLTITDGSK